MIDATRKLRDRNAFSLLEVVMGMMVIALILVPTTAMMSDVLRGETQRHERAELLQLAHGKQNEFAHLARVAFQDRQQNGSFASLGHPRLRFAVDCSDSASSGGIPNRLQAIKVSAWYDENNNLSQDGNEPSVSLWTAVARATP